MSESRSYRVRAADGLPKLMTWREWLEIVFKERPTGTVLAGVAGFDRGQGRQAHALVWHEGEARLYRLADEAGALRTSLSLADRDRLRFWSEADRRGDFKAALSRGEP